ncbi:MAG TPA: SOS response-associated peptidase [Bauldia sp.]|nr:SOS response-associated peptidase [Bauldia sp.]
MCGRFILTASPEAVSAQFSCRVDWFPPRYNIAPGQPIAVVRVSRGARQFGLLRWNFVPGWVRDPRRFARLFNARAESLLGKPSFHGAIRYRRCLVPATGYYLWERPRDGKGRPWLVRCDKAPLIAFAGLWEPWLGADGSEVDGALILTVDAGADVSGFADRMPAIVSADDYERWLDPDCQSSGTALGLLRPLAAGSLVVVPADPRVGNAANDDPALIAAAGTEG